MAQNPSPRAAMEIELNKLSSPRIFLVRMLVFLVLCALVMVVLYKQIAVAFFANPGLNALIGAVALIGTVLSFRQVIRLYPEVAWVNSFRIADPGLAAPLSGMGISFSSSLFGLAGSLMLGFLDLQSSQAQNRFYTDLEDWLASTVREYGGDGSAGGDLSAVVERLRSSVDEGGGRG